MENCKAEPFLFNLRGVLAGQMCWPKDAAACLIQQVLLSSACSAARGAPETIIEKSPFCVAALLSVSV